MASGEPALTTLFPKPRQLTLAGQPVFVGKLKLRQKAELQDWLDSRPQPNPRVRAALDAAGVTGWPISVERMPILIDADMNARIEFLEVALGEFNPEMSFEEIAELAGNCCDDDEMVAIILTAYGHDPDSFKGKQPDPKADAAVPTP